MTTIVTTDEQKERIVEVRELIAQVSTEAQGLKIKNSNDLTNALEVFRRIGALKKQYKIVIENGIIAPIKEGLKNLTSFVSPIKDSLEMAEGTVKREIQAYNDSITEKANVKAAEVEAKVEAGQMSIKQASKQVERIEVKAEIIPTRKHKEVVFSNLALIPDEYWIVDEVKVRKLALAGLVIPGVEVVEKEIIVNR